MNELTKYRFEVVATSYGCNKNLDNEIKNNAGRIPEVTRSVKTSQRNQDCSRSRKVLNSTTNSVPPQVLSKKW